MLIAEALKAAVHGTASDAVTQNLFISRYTVERVDRIKRALAKQGIRKSRAQVMQDLFVEALFQSIQTWKQAVKDSTTSSYVEILEDNVRQVDKEEKVKVAFRVPAGAMIDMRKLVGECTGPYFCTMSICTSQFVRALLHDATLQVINDSPEIY